MNEIPGNPNHNKNVANLAKLKMALEKGHYIGLGGEERPLPFKVDGTVSRGELADALGFARSAFQKKSISVDGVKKKVDSEFTIIVDDFDIKRAGKPGSSWGGNSTNAVSSSNCNEEIVKRLNNKIDRLNRRIGALQVELNTAKKKLKASCHFDDELDNGSVRLPW